ncbi:MAG: restriction endonuclease subunit S [Verrucomicrobia bacterium]|nr:restriction endonuclease subunit S [Verrucomicrobiota bacterium]
MRGKSNFKGKLFFAHAGDVVYSKIDVRNGAIGIIPDSMPLAAVSSEYPVYEVDAKLALPDYIKLVFRTKAFRDRINGMISGASGRKRVQPEALEEMSVPLPPLAEQRAIVERWRSAQAQIAAAEKLVDKPKQRLNEYLHSVTNTEPFEQRSLKLAWADLGSWDVKSSRAAAFRLANPTFKPLAHYAEEATELVKPWLTPEKDWPVYGVNNKEGVFFSHHQKGAEFNAAYKRIRKSWFFHNPTRSSVGSLGVVPEVEADAITSPEYQVWRIREESLIADFVAVLVTTEFFIKLVQFHRVGAVKQRLYVENLLTIPIPEAPKRIQSEIAEARQTALVAIRDARERAKRVSVEVESLILGTKP